MKEETGTPTELPVLVWMGTVEDREVAPSPGILLMTVTCNLLQEVSVSDHSHLSWKCLRVVLHPEPMTNSPLFSKKEVSIELEGRSIFLAWRHQIDGGEGDRHRVKKIRKGQE